MGIRLAVNEDIDALTSIMATSIKQLLSPYLTNEQINASQEFMGLDTTLISDNTYFVFAENDEILGCGGWSARSTLFGGDHTTDRNPGFLNPKTDAARIRAMYTHPDHKRRGIGRAILSVCETAAHHAGFRRTTLVATIAGQKLYQQAEYEIIRRFEQRTSTGVAVPLIEMGKTLNDKTLLTSNTNTPNVRKKAER